ncbi:hypothetical protein RIF29_13881 [Crotalaria pallida]|uniref:Uncharacterized protein n=1 Tax=Crotalaria pallida TaxID=3830 RepID=A0AAN9FCS4_CROPI
MPRLNSIVLYSQPRTKQLLSQTRFPLSSILTHKHVSHRPQPPSQTLFLFSNSLTHSNTLTHSLTHPLTHPLTHSLTHSNSFSLSLSSSSHPQTVSLSLKHASSLSLSLTIMSPSRLHHSLAIWLMKISNQYSKGYACGWI